MRIVRFGPSMHTTKRMEIKPGSRRKIKSGRRRDKIRQKTRARGGREATALNPNSVKKQWEKQYQTTLYFLETMRVRI